MAKRAKKLAPLPQGITNEVVGALADKLNKSPLTIQRMFESGDIRLTTDVAKQVFADKNIVWSVAPERKRSNGHKHTTAN